MLARALRVLGVATVVEPFHRPLWFLVGPSVRPPIGALWSHRSTTTTPPIETADVGALTGVVTSVLEKALEKERRKIMALETEAKEATKSEELQAWAELVVANLWKCNADTRSLEVEDWSTGETRTLTFKKDPKLEVDETFQRCRRLRRGSAVVAGLLNTSRTMTTQLQAALDLDSDDDGAHLDAMLRVAKKFHITIPKATTVEAEVKHRPKTKPSRGSPKTTWTGRTFVAPTSGAPVLIGRNRKENDYLSCVLAKDDDYWLHARGHAGAHVLLQLSKLQRTEQILHDDDLQFAADAAAYYSDAKAESKVTVTVALPKHVLKPPRASPGAVTLRKEYATLIANPDRHRPYHDSALLGTDTG